MYLAEDVRVAESKADVSTIAEVAVVRAASTEFAAVVSAAAT